ncbi:MAG: hypothetical protein EOO73_14295 [Myxococcales bacterium]|nr:MAG: hypothetical protein EOO73_14295 [Myxococcales bacterium]
MMPEPLDDVEQPTSSAAAVSGEPSAAVWPRDPADPSAKLWFSRSYHQFEADTFSDDSDLGWF